MLDPDRVLRAAGGRPHVVFAFAIAGGRVTGIHLLADPERLGWRELVSLEE